MTYFITLPDGTVREANADDLAQMEVTRANAICMEFEANCEIVRQKRSTLLKESDWLSIKAFDTGTPMPEAWATYRQALRDVPAQSGFPETIDWPVPPA